MFEVLSLMLRGQSAAYELGLFFYLAVGHALRCGCFLFWRLLILAHIGGLLVVAASLQDWPGLVHVSLWSAGA
ncbi:MAG: hypothetical protein OIF56_15075 [Cohaesibacter sp.]|nr:hypothetical protein [Cohaesibacter sp.]